MTGYIEISRERGKISAHLEQLYGLSVMAVTLPVPAEIKPGALERRLSRVERILRRASAHRVIFPPEFPYRERFSHFKAAEPLEFYRSVADVLALGWLEIHGVDVRQGRVALAGTRLSPDMEYAARRLCPTVRGICIDVPGEEGSLFAAELQQTFGVPVMPKGVPVDLVVEFSPGGTGQLRLWGEKPFLDGLQLTAENMELPAEIAESVLALLWEQGKIRRGQLRVTPNKKNEEIRKNMLTNRNSYDSISLALSQ